MKLTIIIPLKPVSWNTLLRQHYWKVKKEFDMWKQATVVALQQHQTKPVKKYPITVHVRAEWKQKRIHDVDGLVFKPILDTFIKCNVLPDDSLTYVERVIYTGAIGQVKDQLIITLENMTFEQTQVSIRTKIKQYSEEKKITSQKLADRAGVSYNSIVKWKAGKEACNPTVKNLIGLANAMGVTVAELIGES